MQESVIGVIVTAGKVSRVVTKNQNREIKFRYMDMSDGLTFNNLDNMFEHIRQLNSYRNENQFIESTKFNT